jgi:hypothetical protein
MLGKYTYTYFVLLLGALSAFYGAPVWTAAAIATLLMLPLIKSSQKADATNVGFLLSVASSLAFGFAAFGIGRALSVISGA